MKSIMQVKLHSTLDDRTQNPQYSKTAVLKNRSLKHRSTQNPQSQKPQYSKTAVLKNRSTQNPQFLKYDSCKKNLQKM